MSELYASFNDAMVNGGAACILIAIPLVWIASLFVKRRG